MLITYKQNGKEIENATSNGVIILDNHFQKVEGDITFSIPQYDIYDYDLCALKFKAHTNKADIVEDAFVCFKEKNIQVLDSHLVRMKDFQALYIQVEGMEEIEYCKSCNGATDLEEDKSNGGCLDCAGYGYLS